MRILAFIGIGGFIGCILRYLVSAAFQQKYFTEFPFGTLFVNIIGCLIIGIIVGLSEKFNLSMEWKFFLATGLCGGFTTFSAFSVETLAMIQQGQTMFAFAYVSASVLLGILSTFAGLSILKLF